MFYFWHSAQNSQNQNYYKGLLFEELLRKHLQANGYDVSIQRHKHNSLEYDIEGTHTVDSRKVIGEAKAHEGTISGQDVSAFIGKLMPLHFEQPNNLSGLFLSTSSLSPEAEDFLSALREKTPIVVQRHCGAELEQKVRRSLSLPSSDLAKSVVNEYIPIVTDEHILHSDAGSFLIITGTAAGGALPDRFSILGRDARIIDDEAFLAKIRGGIQSFNELEPITCFSRSLVESLNIKPRKIQTGLLVATEWIDYRKPASPDVFVGRTDQLKDIQNLLEKNIDNSIVEIKSRSGVGKSSVLVTVEHHLRLEGHHAELHDARDAHSATDVLSLFERFCTRSDGKPSFERVGSGLAHLTNSLGEKRAVFMVDQFESTFNNPEVFHAYEYVAMCIARGGSKIAMIYARKDDLLTTHDEICVNLNRLRSLAQPVVLEDFSSVEALELLKRIEKAYPKLISASISAPVLEFAQGFPWLLKRTMAHVVKMLSAGKSQKDLISGGLQLRDLFEEELRGLDEIERGYLRQLASALPATYHSLLRRYEDDPSLPRVLENLTSRKLLRMSGGTYDTYNDVFKEYLLYEKMPERPQAFVFRHGPGTIMSAFRLLGMQNTINVTDFGRVSRISRRGTYSVLRELRHLGLIERDGDAWIVPSEVRTLELQKKLAEHVSKSILKNSLIRDLIGKLERSNEMSPDDIANFLKNYFPFKTGTPKVWKNYTSICIAWLRHLKFAEMTSLGGLRVYRRRTPELLLNLGNLDLSTRGKRRPDASFLPNRGWNAYPSLLSKIHVSPLVADQLSTVEKDVARDLLTIGAIQRDGEDRFTSRWTKETLEIWARETLGDSAHRQFWDAVRFGASYDLAILQAFGHGELSKNTRHRLGKMLATWGRVFGYLDCKMRNVRKHVPRPEPLGQTFLPF